MLDVLCPNNHKWKTNWNRWYNGSRCRICSYESNIRNRIQKHSYEHVKNIIELEPGYKLLTKRYEHVHMKLKIQCDKGHIYKARYWDFKSNNRCPDCCNSKHYSKGEKEILKIIRNLLPDEKIIPNDRNQIINPKTNCNLELDVYIPELEKAVEFNGKYWHNDDYSKYKDNQKQIQCKQKGIDLLVIEDIEWENNRREILKKIKNFVKICSKESKM